MAEPLEVKLLPCPNPWCTDSDAEAALIRRRGFWCVECQCAMRGPEMENKALAVAAWNTRTPDQMAGVDGEVVQAVLAERERCARIAEQAHYATGLGWTPLSIAAAIRQEPTP